MNPKEIKRTLKVTRLQIEDYIQKRKLWFNPEDLGSACGLCSVMVFQTLKKLGCRPTFHMNDWHCFVTVDGHWADLTLKQFDHKAPEVYFSPRPFRKVPYYGNVHKKSQSAKTVKRIRKLFRDWPKEQNPFLQRLPTPL